MIQKDSLAWGKKFKKSKHYSIIIGCWDIQWSVYLPIILGPLLCILYIIDLVDYLRESRFGPALYYASESPIEVASTLGIELDTGSHWLRDNKLTLNVKKKVCDFQTQTYPRW